MDLSQQLAILRPRLLLIILVTVIAGILSFALASLIPKTYEAHATLLVGQVYDTSQPSQPPRLNYDAFLASEQLASTFAQLADTRPVLSAAAAKLGLGDDPTALRERVDAVTPPGSLFITVSARAGDEAGAAALANEVAKELLAEAPGILAGSNVTKAEGVVTLVDPAVPAEAIKSPKVSLYAALGALTALIVAVATIFMLAYRETPPFRRAPAARRVGTPEPLPLNDGAVSAAPVVATLETRPPSLVQARPAAVPEPSPGPMLLTEVRRATPLVLATPAPRAEAWPETAIVRTPQSTAPATVVGAPKPVPASKPVKPVTDSRLAARTQAVAPVAVPGKPAAVAKTQAATKPVPPAKAVPSTKPEPTAKPAGTSRPAHRQRPPGD